MPFLRKTNIKNSTQTFYLLSFTYYCPMPHQHAAIAMLLNLQETLYECGQLACEGRLSVNHGHSLLCIGHI